MKRYLLDTNAVSDWMNQRHGVDLRAREARQRNMSRSGANNAVEGCSSPSV